LLLTLTAGGYDSPGKDTLAATAVWRSGLVDAHTWGVMLAQNYQQFDKEKIRKNGYKSLDFWGTAFVDHFRSNNDIGGLLSNTGVVACICSL